MAIAQAFRAITLHRQPAAFLRTIGGEGRNDGIAVRLHATVQALDISGAVPCLNQEMKRGPVVPDIEGARRLPRGGVRRDPLRLAGCRTNPQLRRRKCGLRQIEHRDFIEAAHEQRIDEPRGAAADIDDCRLRIVGKSLDQAERRLRIRLRPADLLLALVAIDVLPVRLAIGFGHIEPLSRKAPCGIAGEMLTSMLVRRRCFLPG